MGAEVNVPEIPEAVRNGLKSALHGNVSPAEIDDIGNAARSERYQYGLQDTDLVPFVPGRVPGTN